MTKEQEEEIEKIRKILITDDGKGRDAKTAALTRLLDMHMEGLKDDILETVKRMWV